MEDSTCRYVSSTVAPVGAGVADPVGQRQRVGGGPQEGHKIDHGPLGGRLHDPPARAWTGSGGRAGRRRSARFPRPCGTGPSQSHSLFKPPDPSSPCGRGIDRAVGLARAGDRGSSPCGRGIDSFSSSRAWTRHSSPCGHELTRSIDEVAFLALLQPVRARVDPRPARQIPLLPARAGTGLTPGPAAGSGFPARRAGESAALPQNAYVFLLKHLRIFVEIPKRRKRNGKSIPNSFPSQRNPFSRIVAARPPESGRRRLPHPRSRSCG